MRKLLLFVAALAMTVGGLYLVVGSELLLADRIFFRFVIGGAVLATIGAYLLCVDFAAPLLRIKAFHDR